MIAELRRLLAEGTMPEPAWSALMLDCLPVADAVLAQEAVNALPRLLDVVEALERIKDIARTTPTSRSEEAQRRIEVAASRALAALEDPTVGVSLGEADGDTNG